MSRAGGLQTLERQLVPDLEKLRVKCAEYQEYNQLASHKDRLTRWCIGYEITECNKCVLMMAGWPGPGTGGARRGGAAG